MFSLAGVKFKDIVQVEKLKLSSDKVICIVGPSGGGKTTLLKLLNNLLSVEQGKVLYKGINVETWDPIELRREVVMTSQQPVTFCDTIKEELEAGFEMTDREVPEEEKLVKVMGYMQIDKELSTLVDSLSGGERQRLALARSLLINPEVLLLDEPSSALDVDTERRVIKKLIEYAEDNNINLIMVTHSLDIAQNFGDRIIEIEEGEIV